MGLILEDPFTGVRGRINNKGRLETESVTRVFGNFQAINGNTYNIVTNYFELTSSNESGTIYLKSNEEHPIVISNIFLGFGPSTGGSGLLQVKVSKNPTDGTIITAGADITPVNRNFGSAKLLDVTAKKGAEGLTLMNGTFFERLEPTAGIVDLVDLDLVLQRGNAIGIAITPPAGNTSIFVKTDIVCYLNNVFEEQ